MVIYIRDLHISIAIHFLSLKKLLKNIIPSNNNEPVVLSTAYYRGV